MTNMRPIEAAKLLYKNGCEEEACGLLERLWENPSLRGEDEFPIFCALMEVWAAKNRNGALSFLESVISGEGELHAFWERRSLAEQATLLEWHGQCAFVAGDKSAAFSSLTRSASLGRDTSILWRLIGTIHVEHQELELGLRYIRRSLQLHRQLELDLLSGREHPMGFFMGRHPLGLSQAPDDYLRILLDVMKLAKNQKNLRCVRELVLEMIHQTPGDERLMKVRVLLEKAIVQGALMPMPSAAPQERRVAQSVNNPRGFAALFRS
ncbi:MAG: hypothetical protein JST16_06795 [Bdellovibrionales bacterium]|nr:hypothetical protein [Bdellovibrionales bacterium]